MTGPLHKVLYFFRLKTLHFFKMVLVFINKLCDDLYVIDLIVGTKVIRFTGRVVHKFSDGSTQKLRKFNAENFNCQKVASK